MAPYSTLFVIGVFVVGCSISCASGNQWFNDFYKRHDWRHVCRTKISTTCDQLFWELYPCNNGNVATTKSGNLTETNHHASAYTFRPTRHFPWRMCRRLVIRSVPCVHTVKYCCSGWTKDIFGQCNQRAPTTECREGCDNGGTCNVATTKCECPTGYAGERCEQVKCYPACKNGGMCLSVEGIRKCSCPPAFYGQSCENVRCNQECQNGGSCAANGTRSQCICPPGFAGNSCQMAVKDGECPGLKVVKPNHCRVGHVCNHDGDCQFTQKCCFSLTCQAQFCVEPVENTCIYQGVSHDIFSTFHPDPCTSCTCITPDKDAPYGGAICTNKTCPPLARFSRCQAVRTGDTQCCPVCTDTSNQRPEGYTGPVFKNCQMEVTLDLPRLGRVAKLEKNLKAADMFNKDLKVVYSNDTITWVADQLMNFHLVVATAEDEWGEVVECPFIVRITDAHSPEFVDCPSDIVSETGVDVTWDVPQATDNAALSGPPEGDYAPGSTFPLGETLVTYTATDMEGNEALCQFFVFVIHRGAPTTLPPGFRDGRTTERVTSTTANLGLKDRLIGDKEESSNQYYYIGVGLGIAVLIIIVLFVALIFARRRQGFRARHTVQQAAPAGNQMPPAYDTIMQQTNPMVYMQIDVKKLPLSKTPVDNPTYVGSNEMMYQAQNAMNQQNITSSNT